MKIICKKGCSVKSALQIVSEYIEKKGLEYPLISGDLEIEISLKNQKGEEYPGNNQTVYFDEKELELLQRHEKTPDYYNIDALTGLYNRGKYERDIRMFQATGYERLTCVYMDVVGLHEVLAHERARKGSQDITQEIEIYFNFLERYIPPSLQPVLLSTEEQEELRKKEERKDRLYQNYLKRKANGAQKRYEDKIKAKKRAEMDAKKALIRAEDMKKGVFSIVCSYQKENRANAA